MGVLTVAIVIVWVYFEGLNPADELVTLFKK